MGTLLSILAAAWDNFRERWKRHSDHNTDDFNQSSQTDLCEHIRLAVRDPLQKYGAICLKVSYSGFCQLLFIITSVIKTNIVDC